VFLLVNLGAPIQVVTGWAPEGTNLTLAEVAITAAGQPTLGGRDTALDHDLLLRVYRTCDFERVVTLVLAVSEPNPFRVLRPADPARIVVDGEGGRRGGVGVRFPQRSTRAGRFTRGKR
jgi:hypothetical protein